MADSRSFELTCEVLYRDTSLDLLAARDAENDAAICAAIQQSLVGVATLAASETPEAVFARLGGA